MGSEVEMTALLMRCWGSNGASFAREMKLFPAPSAVLVLQSLTSCVGRVLALGAPSTPVWEWGCCIPAQESGGGLLLWGGLVISLVTSLLIKASSCTVDLGRITAIDVGRSSLN